MSIVQHVKEGYCIRSIARLLGIFPATVSEDDYVTSTFHNAKGQREKIYYGNGTNTRYTYDELSYRLTRLRTRKASDVFQDLNYWYDPVGNITTVRDDAQRALYFNNSITLPEQDYTYDAVYRLIKATGREQMGLATFGSSDNYNDNPWMGVAHPGDDNNTQNYTQKYKYDGVGKILSLQHIATAGSYTRTYNYDTASNRLLSTTVGTNTYTYTHDARGNIASMPHLSSMSWSHSDQLGSVGLGGGGTAYYQYSSGERARKVIENGAIVEERLYLGSHEVYRKYISGVLDIERTTVHVADETGRIAMLELRTQGSDASPASLVRYIYTNQLSSGNLELDDSGAIISYEEYHPFGTTSYQAANAAINAAAKRYRFTCKERDEESGLYYIGARYYISWLGKWSAADPINIEWYNICEDFAARNAKRSFQSISVSSYEYCNSNPLRFIDPTGEAYWQHTGGAPVVSGAGTQTDPYLLKNFAVKAKRVVRKNDTNKSQKALLATTAMALLVTPELLSKVALVILGIAITALVVIDAVNNLSRTKGVFDSYTGPDQYIRTRPFARPIPGNPAIPVPKGDADDDQTGVVRFQFQFSKGGKTTDPVDAEIAIGELPGQGVTKAQGIEKVKILMAKAIAAFPKFIKEITKAGNDIIKFIMRVIGGIGRGNKGNTTYQGTPWRAHGGTYHMDVEVIRGSNFGK